MSDLSVLHRTFPILVGRGHSWHIEEQEEQDGGEDLSFSCLMTTELCESSSRHMSKAVE
jgi:hypothetical protein